VAEGTPSVAAVFSEGLLPHPAIMTSSNVIISRMTGVLLVNFTF
jgi:hypothetical protein